MDENKNFDKIDELLESTSEENRVRFNLSDIKEAETQTVLETKFGDFEEFEAAAAAPAAAVAVEPVAKEAPVAPAPVQTIEAVAPAKAEKAEKGGKSKLSVLQIILIAVVAIATLWTVMYTVDHTLAAQGYSPAFSISDKAYDDDSHSFTCLGYKVQFMYDANGNLTQKCVPLLTKGPNDIREANGEIVEVAE